jgi:phosphoketolase
VRRLRRHIKPRLLGRWGSTSGLNLLYVQLNRIIKKHDVMNLNLDSANFRLFSPDESNSNRCRPMSGGRTTTAPAIRIPASSTTS